MTNKKLISITCLVILIFLVAVTILEGCKDGSSQPDTFPQPEERKSVDGVLKTILEAFMATNFIENSETGEMDMIKTPTYEGGLIGPTLRVKPGDTIDFDLINSLPQNPDNQRMGTSEAFPHDPFSTNFHSHGLTVSPEGISDNVLRIMEPGTDNLVQIDIRADHACGTFWYHPHKHGSVSFQFFGGMFGFLIIDDEDCGLNQVPEIAAAKDIVMGFAVIRTDKKTGEVPFVNMEAETFSQNPNVFKVCSGGKSDGQDCKTDNECPGGGICEPPPSLWQFFRKTTFYVTTNGVVNPTLHMRPGEVQRWRLLNAASGETLILALEGHSLNVISQDGLNTQEVVQLDLVEGYVMGAGNRVDVMVKAGEPGTYHLLALDQSTPRSVSTLAGIGLASRQSRIGMDFPVPMFPFPLATIVVSGDPKNMDLPSGPLPPPSGLPSIEDMLDADIAETRNISFDICSPVTQRILDPLLNDLCTFYLNKYDAAYWGGEFPHLLMMRDADDDGNPTFFKEGLFTKNSPLFVGKEAMVAGTFEEWTIINQSNSDHPFHIHQNPFLLTHINGTALKEPEWRDTILVPGASNFFKNPVETAGSVTFRTWFNPITFGKFVMHCHILTHEDVGMMQELEIVLP